MHPSLVPIVKWAVCFFPIWLLLPDFFTEGWFSVITVIVINVVLFIAFNHKEINQETQQRRGNTKTVEHFGPITSDKQRPLKKADYYAYACRQYDQAKQLKTKINCFISGSIFEVSTRQFGTLKFRIAGIEAFNDADAIERLEELVDFSHVLIEGHGEAPNQTIYAQVFNDLGNDIGAILVREGLAKCIPTWDPKNIYERYEKEAKQNRVGGWA